MVSFLGDTFGNVYQSSNQLQDEACCLCHQRIWIAPETRDTWRVQAAAFACHAESHAAESRDHFGKCWTCDGGPITRFESICPGYRQESCK